MTDTLNISAISIKFADNVSAISIKFADPPILAYLRLTTLFIINIIKTSGRGRLWGPALGVVKTLHTDNKQHKENMKT